MRLDHLLSKRSAARILETGDATRASPLLPLSMVSLAARVRAESGKSCGIRDRWGYSSAGQSGGFASHRSGVQIPIPPFGSAPDGVLRFFEKDGLSRMGKFAQGRVKR